MQPVYDVFKSFVDPAFWVFALLFISLIFCFVSGKKKTGVLFLLLALVVFYGLSIEPVSRYLSYRLEKDYIKPLPAADQTPLDVIVVLGGGAYDIHALNQSFAGESSIARVVYAVQMFHRYNPKYLICSGTGREKASIAEIMAKLAGDLGVPKEKIRIEDKSRNTYEHAVEFNKLFADKNLRIGLVTSACHLKRSETEFRKYFKNVTPLPAGYLYFSPLGTAAVRYVPQSQWLLNNCIVVKEHVGRLWYGIKDI